MNYARFFCLPVLVLIGCQKIIEPKDLPEQDPRLVLNCLMYEDSLIKLNVSSSKSIISGKDYKFIENATCVLYEDDLIIDQFDNKKEGNYISHVFPKMNKKYTVKVSAAGFESVEGSTALPDSVVLVSSERYDLINSNYYTYSTGQFGLRYLSGNTKCLLKIKNNLNAKEYYTMQPIVVLVDSAGNFVQEVVGAYVTNNTASASGDFISGNIIEVDDESALNGNNLLLDLDIGVSGDAPYATAAEVYLIIASVSEDLYKYKTTVRNQANSGVSLFAEPVLPFNNIKNGMGIVGGMNSRSFFLYKVPLKNN